MEENQIQIDEILTNYLFHNLSETEEEELQKELLERDDLYERLEIVEMKLIDSFVRDQMTTDEKDRFEKQFLIFPQNQEKVKEAQIFHEALTSWQQNRTPDLPAPPIVTGLSGPFSRSGRFLVLAVAFSVIIVSTVFLATPWNQPSVSVPLSVDNTPTPDMATSVTPTPEIYPKEAPTQAEVVPAKTNDSLSLSVPGSSADIRSKSALSSSRSLVLSRSTSILKINLAVSVLNNMGNRNETIDNASNRETIRFIIPVGKAADRYRATIKREHSSDLPIVVKEEFTIRDRIRTLDVDASKFREGSTYVLEFENLNRPFRLRVTRNPRAND